MELFHVLKIVTVSALLTVSLSACEDAGKAQSVGKKSIRQLKKQAVKSATPQTTLVWPSMTLKLLARLKRLFLPIQT